MKTFIVTYELEVNIYYYNLYSYSRIARNFCGFVEIIAGTYYILGTMYKVHTYTYS